jgi:multiple sugar transport system permease protein
MNTNEWSSFTTRLNRWLIYAVLILVLIFILTPVGWLLVSSLKKPSELLAYPIAFLPKVPQWTNYVLVFTRQPFIQVALRTVVLAITAGTIQVFTSAMCGYAFARYQGPGNRILFPFVVALLILPQIVTLIPQFIVYTRLHLTNTYFPWYLAALGTSAYFIFMFRQFFYNFPKELEEAAEIDGCGPLRIFLQIFLPNAQPVLATASIFAVTGIWGDYLTPILYLSENKTLLAVKIATSYVDPKGIALPTVSLAANVVFMLPLVILFFFGQKYIMKGVVTSGLKG